MGKASQKYWITEEGRCHLYKEAGQLIHFSHWKQTPNPAFREILLYRSLSKLFKNGSVEGQSENPQNKMQLILWPKHHFKTLILMHSSNFRNKLSPSANASATKIYYYYFDYYSTETLHSQAGPHYAKPATIQSKDLCTQFTKVFQL